MNGPYSPISFQWCHRRNEAFISNRKSLRTFIFIVPSNGPFRQGHARSEYSNLLRERRLYRFVRTSMSRFGYNPSRGGPTKSCRQGKKTTALMCNQNLSSYLHLLFAPIQSHEAVFPRLCVLGRPKPFIIIVLTSTLLSLQISQVYCSKKRWITSLSQLAIGLGAKTDSGAFVPKSRRHWGPGCQQFFE